MSVDRENRVCVAAVMKNERSYIIEWVAWYRLLGSEVMIADNGGDDGQTPLLMRMESAGLIRRFDLRAIKTLPQIAAYHVMFNAARDTGIRYLAFFDADEFFEPLQPTAWKGSGADLVRRLFAETGAAAIGFNWMCFGSSHLINPPSEPVIEAFTRAAPKDFVTNRHIKSVLDVDKCTDLLKGRTLCSVLHPHGLIIGDANYSHDGAGCFHSSPHFGITDHVRWDNARIRHYFVKSYKDFLRKAARGRADVNSDIRFNTYNHDLFTTHDRNDVDVPMHPEALSLLRHEINVIESELSQISIPPIETPAAADLVVNAMEQLFEHRLDAIRAELDEIRASTSWKITAPIRNMVFRLHQLMAVNLGQQRATNLRPATGEDRPSDAKP